MIAKLLASLLAVTLLAAICLAAGKPISDGVISDQVMIKLSSDPVVKGGGLHADVKDGVVTLTGSVAEQKQKDKAGKIAKGVKGVKQVINNITVAKSGSK
ncbi:MAG TPA: BON domain-containing protein [Verrucomicrobiae bacterium]|nr:BON domain-containing protein [Verrucomicrobiae bacterium]